MPSDVSDLVAASVALLRSERDLHDMLEEGFKRAGLPGLDCYLVLEDIAASPAEWLRQSTLQKNTRLAQYSICRLVDRLVRDGLVERQTCPVDGRNNVVILTDRGRAVHAQMQPVYEQAVASHFGGLLTLVEARQLQSLLTKLQRG